MADLTDAELDHLASNPLRPLMVRAAAEIRALRARVVGGTDGPDQGDPAAWGVADAEGTVIYAGGRRAAAEQMAARLNGTVVPLRAPGAVAAAPPADALVLEELRRRLDGSLDADEVAALDLAAAAARTAVAAAPPGDEGSWIACCDHCGCRPGQREGHDDTCSHGCNDAPPAGHEDEADVERAADDLDNALLIASDGAARIDRETLAQTVRLLAHGTDAGDFFDDFRAALAAARGPRTPDPGAGA